MYSAVLAMCNLCLRYEYYVCFVAFGVLEISLEARPRNIIFGLGELDARAKSILKKKTRESSERLLLFSGNESHGYKTGDYPVVESKIVM